MSPPSYVYDIGTTYGCPSREQPRCPYQPRASSLAISSRDISLTSIIAHSSRMLGLPVALVGALGPAPEEAPAHLLLALLPEALAEEDRVAAAGVDDQQHLVLVARGGAAPGQLGGEVRGGDLGLVDGHVPHLRPGEVDGVARRVHALRPEHAHRLIDADEPALVRQPRPSERARALERRDEHEQVVLDLAPVARAHEPRLDLRDGEVVERLDAGVFERGAQGRGQLAAARVLGRVVGREHGDARPESFVFEAAREREGRLVDGDFEARAGAGAEDGVAAAELPHGVAELERRLDGEEVVRVLEEAGHLLGGEAAPERVDEVVVAKLAREVAARHGHAPGGGVYARDHALDEAHAALAQRGAQVVRDVVGPALAEGEADERRVEREPARARDHRDLVLRRVEQARQALRRHHAREPAPEDEYVRHFRYPEGRWTMDDG